MSEAFKKKLTLYENGQLEGEELTAFEEELEKIEHYQEYLKENEGEPQLQMNEKKQKKILKRSRWGARLQTALTALGIIVLFMIVSTVLTTVYYSWGTPDRVDVFRNVIDHTLTITEPYGYAGGTSSNVDFFFKMEMTRDINKRVGRDGIKVAELTIPFFFSQMGYPERESLNHASENHPAFSYPVSVDRGMSDWDRLEHLPEGTVVSAYVSFENLLDTGEVFQHFSGKDLDITWLAVDTGVEEEDDWDAIFDPIGFPNFPIWHEDDMIQHTSEEKKGFLFSKIVTSGYSSPDYDEGDTDIFHKQFLKTLNFLEKHEKKVERLYRGWKLDLGDRIKYLETNGINHYGIVITGPTKEVLKLQDEEIISFIEIDEVGFWNW